MASETSLIILGGSLIIIGVFRNYRNKSILQQINDRELLRLQMELDEYNFDEIKKTISAIQNDMNEDLSNISKSYTFNELFKVSQCCKLLIRISYSRFQKELNINIKPEQRLEYYKIIRFCDYYSRTKKNR